MASLSLAGVYTTSGSASLLSVHSFLAHRFSSAFDALQYHLHPRHLHPPLLLNSTLFTTTLSAIGQTLAPFSQSSGTIPTALPRFRAEQLVAPASSNGDTGSARAQNSVSILLPGSQPLPGLVPRCAPRLPSAEPPVLPPLSTPPPILPHMNASSLILLSVLHPLTGAYYGSWADVVLDNAAVTSSCSCIMLPLESMGDGGNRPASFQPFHALCCLSCVAGCVAWLVLLSSSCDLRPSSCYTRTTLFLQRSLQACLESAPFSALSAVVLLAGALHLLHISAQGVGAGLVPLICCCVSCVITLPCVCTSFIWLVLLYCGATTADAAEVLPPILLQVWRSFCAWCSRVAHFTRYGKAALHAAGPACCTAAPHRRAPRPHRRGYGSFNISRRAVAASRSGACASATPPPVSNERSPTACAPSASIISSTAQRFVAEPGTLLWPPFAAFLVMICGIGGGLSRSLATISQGGVTVAARVLHVLWTTWCLATSYRVLLLSLAFGICPLEHRVALATAIFACGAMDASIGAEMLRYRIIPSFFGGQLSSAAVFWKDTVSSLVCSAHQLPDAILLCWCCLCMWCNMRWWDFMRWRGYVRIYVRNRGERRAHAAAQRALAARTLRVSLAEDAAMRADKNAQDYNTMSKSAAKAACLARNAAAYKAGVARKAAAHASKAVDSAPPAADGALHQSAAFVFPAELALIALQVLVAVFLEPLLHDITSRITVITLTTACAALYFFFARVLGLLLLFDLPIYLATMCSPTVTRAFCYAFFHALRVFSYIRWFILLPIWGCMRILSAVVVTCLSPLYRCLLASSCMFGRRSAPGARFQLRVTMPKREPVILFVAPGDTILSVKILLAASPPQAFGVPIAEQRLVHGNQVLLDDSQTLRGAGIDSDCPLILGLSKGGGLTGGGRTPRGRAAAPSETPCVTPGASGGQAAAPPAEVGASTDALTCPELSSAEMDILDYLLVRGVRSLRVCLLACSYSSSAPFTRAHSAPGSSVSYAATPRLTISRSTCPLPSSRNFLVCQRL